MIEMVYSGKESNERQSVKIPKNIRQIGDNKSNFKIYIEDYVSNTLKKCSSTENGVQYGILLGDVKKSEDNTYVFVKAMVKVREVIENSLIFNDEIWSELYSDVKKYFDGMDIVGWFASLPYRVSDDMNGIKKIHLDNFAGNEKVCFLNDRTEKEENFYCFKDGNFKKQQGYYIYYEKNEKMKKYVKNSNNEKNNQQNNTAETKATVKDNKNQKVVPVKPEEKNSDPKTFREIIKETTQDTRYQGRLAYGASGLLIIALLLSTVVMLNNYGELKTIKKTLASFNSTQEAKAVGEILSAYDEVTTVAETESATVIEETTAKPTTETKKVEKSVASVYSGQTYTVKKGQTLYDISMKYYGTSKMVDKIKEANNIDDDYTIVEGQKIILP